jgi:hypothetical protein
VGFGLRMGGGKKGEAWEFRQVIIRYWIVMKRKETLSSYDVLKSDEDIVHFLFVNVSKQKQKEFYEKYSFSHLASTSKHLPTY